MVFKIGYHSRYVSLIEISGLTYSGASGQVGFNIEKSSLPEAI